MRALVNPKQTVTWLRVNPGWWTNGPPPLKDAPGPPLDQCNSRAIKAHLRNTEANGGREGEERETETKREKKTA